MVDRNITCPVGRLNSGSTGSELEITTFSIELDENTESTDGHCCQSLVAVEARLNVCSNVAAAVVGVWLEMYGVGACNANF